MPVVDVIVLFVLLYNHVGVSVVELSVELGVLSDRLKFFNAVDLKNFLASLSEESLCLCLQFLDMYVELFSFHLSEIAKRYLVDFISDSYLH